MNIQFNDNRNIEHLLELIKQNALGDYIYMYPPRQSYTELQKETAIPLMVKSIDELNDINLYFHIPFCKQICSFCNLYTKVSSNEQEYEEYIDLLIKELSLYKNILKFKKVNTIYIGGGTPSLLPPPLIQKIFDGLMDLFEIDVFKIPEVAIEVAPDTVDHIKFEGYKKIGINRVNIGFQTVSETELKNIGRKHGVSILEKSISTIQEINFSNVCIDLIYGLQNQSLQDWLVSVEKVINFEPETICIYSLTLRPATIYHKKGYKVIDNSLQYQKYESAVALLIKNGYKQETHTRFTLENGGYLQKVNHWKLQNVLGFGAGARSYLWYCDTRNDFSLAKRESAFNNYRNEVNNGIFPVKSGFIMNSDERIRKAVILNIINLDRTWFVNLFNHDVISVFPILSELEKYGFIAVTKESISLTALGLKYRDLIIQLFFSDEIVNKISKYSYAD